MEREKLDPKLVDLVMDMEREAKELNKEEFFKLQKNRVDTFLWDLNALEQIQAVHLGLSAGGYVIDW